jgi:hypothetical protein
MYQKKNGLTINGENLVKIYVAENKIVSSFLIGAWQKTRGEKMKDSLAMLLKTHGEKMSVYGSLAILMKTN